MSATISVFEVTEQASRVGVRTDESRWQSVVEATEDEIEFAISEGGMVRADTGSDPLPPKLAAAVGLQLIVAAGYDPEDMPAELKTLSDRLQDKA